MKTAEAPSGKAIPLFVRISLAVARTPIEEAAAAGLPAAAKGSGAGAAPAGAPPPASEPALLRKSGGTLKVRVYCSVPTSEIGTTTTAKGSILYFIPASSVMYFKASTIGTSRRSRVMVAVDAAAPCFKIKLTPLLVGSVVKVSRSLLLIRRNSIASSMLAPEN